MDNNNFSNNGFNNNENNNNAYDSNVNNSDMSSNSNSTFDNGYNNSSTNVGSSGTNSANSYGSYNYGNTSYDPNSNNVNGSSTTNSANGNSTNGSYNNIYGNYGNSGYGSTNSYGTSGNYGNPYEAPNSQQNSYQNSENNYQQSGNWNPYMGMDQNSTNDETPKAPRKHSGFGMKLGKCAAMAAVFGMVAGGAFTGVNYAGSKALGISAVSSTATSGSTNDGISAPVKNTSTGSAKDLVDVSSIVSEVMPSIVAITNISTVTYQSFFGYQQQPTQSCGTGVIIDKDDKYLYISTNNHVVADSEELKVQFADETTVKAEIRGTDPSDDLAVVMVKLTDIPDETFSKIKLATIGDSDALKVGDASIAIGNALGYGQSVTTGVISALGRSVTSQDETTGQTVTNNNLIQTDAAINPGNSGGALLNEAGEVIGINSVKYSSTDVEGFGFAIAMADAKPIIEDLIKNGEYTQTAFLGIQGGDVSSEVASVYNMPQGVYVNSVKSGCGADKAGIQQGDIIVKFEGKKITTMAELQSKLSAHKAGEKVTITISRQSGNGYEEQDIQVVLNSEEEVK